MKKVLLAVCLLVISVASINAQEIFDAVKSGNLTKVKELVENDSQLLNARNSHQSTPLHTAVDAGYVEIVNYLIGKGADVNSTNRSEQTPLFYAKTAEIAKLLISNGANVNVQNYNKVTPLMFASSLAVAKVLVENGADINHMRPGFGSSALFQALIFKRVEVADYLLDLGAVILDPEVQWGKDEFIYSLKAGCRKYLDKFLEKGFNPFINDESKNSLIHYAAVSNSVELVSKLIEIGAPINAMNIFGWNPLHVAVYNKSKDVVKFLIGKGLDKNERTVNGKSPYNLAKGVNSKEIVEYLISMGADTTGSKFPELMGDYFSQQNPGKTTEPFAPGIVSAEYHYHSSIMFSPDGNEAYWSGMGGGYTIYFSKKVNGKWTEPERFSEGDVPVISPDGKKFYFVGIKKTDNGSKEIIYVRDKTGTGWSVPRELSERVNSVEGIHWQLSVDKSENIFFGAHNNNKSKIYYAVYKNGKYSEPKIVEELKDIEALSPFISPDGSYLIVVDVKTLGLIILFRKKDGSWANGISISDYLKFKQITKANFVTRDGKYLFFTAGLGIKNIPYWVDASFIEDLRKEALNNDI